MEINIPKLNKNLLIFHSGDTDGLMSGSLLKNISLKDSNNQSTILVGYNYQTPERYNIAENHNQLMPDNIVDYNNVYMTDVMPKLNWWEVYVDYLRINCNANYKQIITIFEHHQNAIEDLIQYLTNDALFNVDVENENFIKFIDTHTELEIHLYYNFINSATKIVWDYYIQNNPELFEANKNSIINFISEYDTWQWINNYPEPNMLSLYLEMFLRDKYQLKLDSNNIIEYGKILDYLYLTFFADSENILTILNEGKEIFDTKFAEVKKSGITYGSIYGKNLVLIFNEAPTYILQHYVTEFIKENYPNIIFDGMMFIKFDKDLVKLSLRQINKDFNCNNFVKQFINVNFESNSGGHSGAAGAAFDIKKFNDFNTQFNYGIS